MSPAGGIPAVHGGEDVKERTSQGPTETGNRRA